LNEPDVKNEIDSPIFEQLRFDDSKMPLWTWVVGDLLGLNDKDISVGL
jgi:hypothetical protein